VHLIRCQIIAVQLIPAGANRRIGVADPGVRRAFPSFSQAVLELNDARVFAGIHFRTACLDGNALGIKVAFFVMQQAMRPVPDRSEVGQ